MTFQGNPCWYELATSDLNAARAFYAKVMGWQVADSGMEGFTYLLARAGSEMVAGGGFPVVGAFACETCTVVEIADIGEAQNSFLVERCSLFPKPLAVKVGPGSNPVKNRVVRGSEGGFKRLFSFRRTASQPQNPT